MRLLFFLLLLAADQIAKFTAADYLVNPGITFGFFSYRWPLVACGTLIALFLTFFYRTYTRFYGRRPLFTLFYLLTMASDISTIIDRIIFGGGRDFIQIGHFVTNLGDIYTAVGLIALGFELVVNRRGSIMELIKGFRGLGK